MRKILKQFSSTKSSNNVYIVAAKRTPIGAFLGKLSSFSATQLGGIAIQGAIQSIKIHPKQINEVILGNVLSAGLGQAPARQASLKGGIPTQVPCTTINKVCSSGLKSIVFASQSIALSHTDAAIAGGFESMSNTPYYVQGARVGFKYGDKHMVDGIAFDGLTDPFNNIAMGICAEKTAKDYKITRQMQDQYCRLSYKRHFQARKNGLLATEIVPVTIKSKKGDQQITEDQQYEKYVQSKVSQLKPAFDKNGTITAANASKLNDGACAVVLMSEQKMNSLGVKPLARIVNYADYELQPIDFSIAPYYAAKKVLEKAKMTTANIDLFEFNEAFSVVALANMKLLDISQEKVNIFGGAVALGHPLGMSGARIVQSLMTGLKSTGGKYGLAGICNGGGGSTAMIIENLQ